MPYLPFSIDPAATARGNVLLFAGRPLDATSLPADDAEAVMTWQGVGIDVDLAQVTAGSRPLADDDAFPGRWAVIFTSNRHLTVTPPQPVRTALIILRAGAVGSRTLLTRDTSATTTKAAYRLVIEESVG